MKEILRQILQMADVGLVSEEQLIELMEGVQIVLRSGEAQEIVKGQYVRKGGVLHRIHVEEIRKIKIDRSKVDKLPGEPVVIPLTDEELKGLVEGSMQIVPTMTVTTAELKGLSDGTLMIIGKPELLNHSVETEIDRENPADNLDDLTASKSEGSDSMDDKQDGVSGDVR